LVFNEAVQGGGHVESVNGNAISHENLLKKIKNWGLGVRDAKDFPE
jgi:hypothetical protein